MFDEQTLLNGLDDSRADVRLKSLEGLMKKAEAGEDGKSRKGSDVNNHIHTTWSFSPYTPAKAIWMAYNAGLCTAGIMDHDSISGAEEFISAGRIAGVATTIGVECRVDFSGTALAGHTINNPDQDSIAYVASQASRKAEALLKGIYCMPCLSSLSAFSARAAGWWTF